MTTEKCQSFDAVDFLLLAAMVTIESVIVLAIAAVALVLTVAGWRPAPPQAPPMVHPLALVAAELEVLPVSRLRELAGVRSKRLRKSELVAVLAAC